MRSIIYYLVALLLFYNNQLIPGILMTLCGAIFEIYDLLERKL
jgi:hypothetical protein